ncbi:MAG TPA: hypothetical protein DCY13_06835, partial [Verrucomicrobiales bacterium]|nr:hypothetical protein [Verrucomicrobiales bacterium]
PSAPVLLSSTFGRDWVTYGVAVRGNVAYLAKGKTVQIVDVSNPRKPATLGRYDEAFNALDIVVAGDHAYVADGPLGLLILDVSDPGNPRWAGSFDTEGFARNILLKENLAIIGDAQGGLLMLDVSVPGRPEPVGRFDTGGAAAGLTVVGNHLYVTAEEDGLIVIDISDPARPRRIGSCDTPGAARGVQVQGNLAYVADDHAGLQVVDVSSTAPLRFLPPFRSASGAVHLFLEGAAGQRATIQRTADFNAWETWRQVVLPQGPLEIIDPAETSARRFYRAVGH